MNMFNSEEQKQKTITKRIIHRPKKAKIMITRKTDSNPYGPRVKSAPPISIPEIVIRQPVVEEKKHVLLKADGTPLTLSDLESDSDSSSEEEDMKVEDVKVEDLNVENVKVEDIKEEKTRSTSSSTTTLIPESICLRCKHKDVERIKSLEELLILFPPSLSSQKSLYTIADILGCKKSTPFKLNLMKKETTKKKASSSTYVIDKNRKDTVVELARLELNKLTMGNFQAVISKMKKLDVQTIEEAKEIANCLLDKAISEPTFTQVYARAVGELRKVLRSKEELGMNVKQTAFYGTLLTRAFAIVSEKVQWADTSKQINLKDFANRILYEEQIELMEELRYRKKNRTIGAIMFVSHLYIENIIAYNKIGERIEELMKDPHYESVEVLCAFLSNIGEKLLMSNKEQIVNRIFNYLSSIKSRYEFRIQFLIETTFENRKKWKKPVTGGSQTQNRFACMEVEENEPQAKKVEEPVDDNSAILSFIGSIYSEILDSYDEDDRTIIADHFKRGVTNYGIQPFYSLYLSEAISDYKKAKAILPFFVDYFDRTGLTNSELVDLLKDLLGNLKELKMDFPKAAVNYVELICLLKVKGLLSQEQFESLKSPDFSLKAKEVISKWNKSEDLKEKISEAFEQALINEVLKK